MVKNNQWLKNVMKYQTLQWTESPNEIKREEIL